MSRHITKLNRRTANRVGLKMDTLKKSGYRCQVCGTTEDLTMDHIMPKSLHGPTLLSNLQILCRFHNHQKGSDYGDQSIRIRDTEVQGYCSGSVGS